MSCIHRDVFDKILWILPHDMVNVIYSIYCAKIRSIWKINKQSLHNELIEYIRTVYYEQQLDNRILSAELNAFNKICDGSWKDDPIYKLLDENDQEATYMLFARMLPIHNTRVMYNLSVLEYSD